MPDKLGNGGHGLEAYDPDTGRYIKEGDNSYHAGAHFSVNEISDMITNGYYGDDFKKLYDEGDDDAKTAIIGYLQTKLDAYYTKNKLENQKDYKMLTRAEFDEYAKDCKAVCNPADYRYFNNNYRGAGNVSFEFNKCLRTGEEKYLKLIGMSKSEFDAQVAAFDRLTSSYKAPRDMQGMRFDETGPLVSYFSQSGALNGVPQHKNQYGYMVLDEDKVDLNDLKNRLLPFIGTTVPGDKAFTSFSCAESSDKSSVASHMIKNPDKIVVSKYNIPKGNDIFLSDYGYESEGMLPRNTKLIIQDVAVEKIGGKDRLVLYYGLD